MHTSVVHADFVVSAEEIARVVVDDPVRVRFVDVSEVGFLGETGRKMALAGFTFVVTKGLAEALYANRQAVYASEARERL